MQVTNAMKRDALEREIKMRRRVYPRRVSEGRMTQEFADEQIEIMKAILSDYPPDQKEMF